MRRERYFDHAATAPMDVRVFEAMRFWLERGFGNPHSLHEPGRAARAAVERAREQVAALLGAEDPMEIVFTSGATEALNTVIRSFSHVAISPFEHSAVREPALHKGAEVLAIDPTRGDPYGLAPPANPSDLVAVMAVNNETGAILTPPPALPLLVDATQAAGKVRFDLGDFAAVSAHKFYGPQGVGALYARGGAWPEPLLRGGEQEYGVRAGTLNVAGIVGMGAAAELAAQEVEKDAAHATELRGTVLEILASLDGWATHDGLQQSPFILSVSFDALQGETLVLELDQRGFAVSSGAACSSRSTEPSHVLVALELPETRIRGAMRISFGRSNTLEEAQNLGRALRETVLTVRKLGFRA